MGAMESADVIFVSNFCQAGYARGGSWLSLSSGSGGIIVLDRFEGWHGSTIVFPVGRHRCVGFIVLSRIGFNAFRDVEGGVVRDGRAQNQVGS